MHVKRTSCYRSANKLLQICSQAVDKLCSHCLFLVVGTSLEQTVNNLKQAWWHDYKVVLASLIQSWYINTNATRLTTQGCNKIVISWLYRTCWNNLATSLIISTRLLQVVNNLFQTCWQLGTSSANTTCWQLVGRLATRCEIFQDVCSFHHILRAIHVAGQHELMLICLPIPHSIQETSFCRDCLQASAD
jgi:hypothetical protein